ncbi:hypothetical protein L596_022308 [Steinernema carpocapsae]|uniref:Uncharacterized protein n=1 Tax=Steinernema carpocapsae TaxID=34508 RepID=A0A4U5MM71_STECR|nr:hypothetical protein L596_022308 [Steinernema carpocapsae]
MNLSWWYFVAAVVVFSNSYAASELTFLSVSGDENNYSAEDAEDNDAYCKKPCEEKFRETESREQCFEGCRLALIYRYFDQSTSDESTVIPKCQEGCEKSYKDDKKDAVEKCSEGCTITTEPSNGVVRIEMDENDPTFNVANEMISDPLKDSFIKTLGLNELFGENEAQQETFNGLKEKFGNSQRDSDPFAVLLKHLEHARQRMENSFRVFEEDWPSKLGEKVGKLERPSGHELTAFEGKPVDNFDDFGKIIIHSQPADYDDMVRSYEKSFREAEFRETALRAERIAQIGHYAVKIILVILFIVVLLVALAMVRHHSAMSYRHLNQRPMFGAAMTGAKTAEAGPLPPKDENIYSTVPVHGSPPPAYDQLSIKKVNHE